MAWYFLYPMIEKSIINERVYRTAGCDLCKSAFYLKRNKIDPKIHPVTFMRPYECALAKLFFTIR